MTQKLNITVPKPCSADWDKMSPCEQGRHCKSCDKTVVDFTRMSSDQMDAFIIQNLDTKICGHFNREQLNIPKNKFHSFFLDLYSKSYSNLKYDASRAAALFVLGSILTLTGCEAPKKNEIEKSAKPPIETQGRNIQQPNHIEGKISATQNIRGEAIATPVKPKEPEEKNRELIKGKVAVAPQIMGDVCIPEEKK